MKKKLAVIFLAFMSVTLFASCKSEKRYRIGVSQCSHDDWRSKMNDEIYREIMFHPEAEVEIRSADDSNEKQIADIRYFKDNGFDIIIAAPNEADAITPIIKEVYESGTPVIIFDRNVNGKYYTAYQWADNVAIGRDAAHYARHLVGRGGKVIEIYGLKGSTPAIGRHNGFVEGAEEAGLHLLASGYGNWNYEDAAAVADSLLTQHPDADIVYAHNDRMAIGASEVARNKGLNIKVIGVDAAPEIGIKAVADSVIDATFLYPTEGYRLINTAINILEGRPYDKEVYLPVSSPVDLSNADILLLQNKELNGETEKIRVLKGQVDEFWSRYSAQRSLYYAFAVIFILILGVLFLLLRAFWQHRRHQKALEVQNEELASQASQLKEQHDSLKALNEQLNDAVQSKLAFFTNVSHDLRTPLTLIAEPVEQLAAADNLTPRQSTLMKIANKNVRILRRLINQILDFRKFESGKMDMRLTEVSFADLAAEWADAFCQMARKRDIKLTVDIDLPEGFTMAIDVEKMERVFYNLMSNAFKYTPDNGRIKFTVKVKDNMLVYAIDDTGCGIPADALGKIFDRFYQVDKVLPDGSGIGLSLTKAFVELHYGTISVSSQPGKGTVFTVEIPARHVADTAASASAGIITPETLDVELGDIEPEPSGLRDGKPILLVIDDNEDIRSMLVELLSDTYTVITASNGKEGLRLAAKYVPDLIICDVMMPVMNGLECCRRLKDEMSTSHIPVLMLTACSRDEQRLQGYESGADGYLSKPFSAGLLEARCHNLIENRKKIKELWIGSGLSVKKKADDTKVVRPDVEDEFYARFLDIVSAVMGNPDLNVDYLASKMGLGRSQFYRKIKALTNYSPVELLRSLRLKRSRELLTTTRKTISEIAYEVGFSTPAYFTRCYKEAFGETPSELRERLAGA